MSRSQYTHDYSNWDLIRWRGQVTSARKGKRGQKLLKELAQAMDSMIKKELITNELEKEGEYCALGVVGASRGLQFTNIDPEDPDQVAEVFDIASPLAREITYLNDEHCSHMSPEERWKYMRTWVDEQIASK